MKLPPQVAAVPRQSEHQPSTFPVRGGHGPLGVDAKWLQGGPHHDDLSTAKAKHKIAHIGCAGKDNGGHVYRWVYCKNTKSYECCPDPQKCKDDNAGCA
jgi:hypothetical protein